MSQVSTAGRLLGDLYRESAALGEMVGCGAGILHQRVEGAMRGDVRLTLAEQLRLAEATMVLAKTIRGARPVSGSMQLSARSPAPQRLLRAGDVVVVSLDGSSASLRPLDSLTGTLSSERLAAAPLSALI